MIIILNYAKAVLKFAKLNTVAQQREAVTRGRSLLPYRLRYMIFVNRVNSSPCPSCPLKKHEIKILSSFVIFLRFSRFQK
ncbi:MAG: hypothetical protein LBK06_02725, partial [Planctomycetaceae bacterium]|nr:hypothetical protein [Planctomycetaceae bacterium]